MKFSASKPLSGLFFAVGAIFASVGSTQAFELEYSVAGSSYGVSGSESAADLMTVFGNASPYYCDQLSLSEFTNVATGSLCGTGNTDLADRIELSFNLADETDFSFRIGTDWGRGGAVIVDSNLAYITNQDIWWGYSWGNSDVIYTDVTLTAGFHTLQWIGFESCCNGNRSLQFSANGGGYQAVSESNFASLEATGVPSAPSLALMVIGAFGLRRAQQR